MARRLSLLLLLFSRYEYNIFLAFCRIKIKKHGNRKRDSVAVGTVGMCITCYLMELWESLFAECGKAAL